MIAPSRDDFRALARRYTVIPVWRELLADLTTPVAAFCRVVGDEPGFLLESQVRMALPLLASFGLHARHVSSLVVAAV